jgi:nitroimidazol reductase NimA-like FMN-containing flavoprotein (pyridoxamine 5'-phosphate oxidase superfamily)
LVKYHMRLQEREITDRAQILEVLREGKYATLAMCRDNEPYVVTMNYGYDEGRHALYFHCAHAGLKIDFITRNPTVCGTVIEDRGYVQGECAHAYRTVVFWGEMRVVEALDEKKRALQAMLDHLEDDPDEVKRKTLQDDRAYERVAILRLDIREISSKQGR